MKLRQLHRLLGSDAVPEKVSGAGYWLSVAFFVVAFGLFVNAALPMLTFPYGMNDIEGVIVDQVRRVHEEPGLYPPFDSAPYVMDNYGPVYPILVSLIPRPAGSVFFGGRLISAMSTLVCAMMLVLIVRRYSGEAVGFLCAGVFLLVPEVQRWGVLMRVDMLALALSLTGLHLLYRPELRWRILAGLCFFLCVYTRHSMLAVLVVASLMLWAREGRDAFKWIGGLLVAGIVAWGVGDLVTDGRMYLHMIEFNLLNFSWERTTNYWLKVLWPWRLLLPMAAFCALLPLDRTGLDREIAWRRKVFWVLLLAGVAFLVSFGRDCLSQEVASLSADGDSFLQRLWKGARGADVIALTRFHGALALAAAIALVKWFFREGRRVPADVGKTGAVEDPEGVQGLMVLVGLPSAALIGRVGSDVNYLIEHIVLLLVVVGMGLTRGTLRWRAFVLVCLLGYAAHVSMGYSQRDARPERLEERALVSSKILDYLAERPGPILSEDPSYPAILGRPLEYQPFMYRQITDAGVWDPNPVVRDILKQRFVAVVRKAGRPYAVGDDGRIYFPSSVWLKQSGFSAAMDEAIRTSYDPDPATQGVEQITPLYFRATAVWLPEKKPK